MSAPALEARLNTVQNNSYLVDTAKSCGRGALMLLNAGILVAPALAAINGANKYEWSELISDSAAHVMTIGALSNKNWATASVIINVSRIAILGLGLSTFPTGAQYFDFGLHTANLIGSLFLAKR